MVIQSWPSNEVISYDRKFQFQHYFVPKV